MDNRRTATYPLPPPYKLRADLLRADNVRGRATKSGPARPEFPASIACGAQAEGFDPHRQGRPKRKHGAILTERLTSLLQSASRLPPAATSEWAERMANLGWSVDLRRPATRQSGARTNESERGGSEEPAKKRSPETRKKQGILFP